MTRRSLLRISLALTAVISCGPRALPRPRNGTSYQLSLVVLTPRHISPDRERAIRPMTDSAGATITITATSKDTAFGTYAGLPLGFWPMFRGIDSLVSIVVSNNEWRITLDPTSTDAGMELIGWYRAGVVRGKWVTRTAFPDSGTFVLRPGA